MRCMIYDIFNSSPFNSGSFFHHLEKKTEPKKLSVLKKLRPKYEKKLITEAKKLRPYVMTEPKKLSLLEALFSDITKLRSRSQPKILRKRKKK